jgi:formylglycine-generating enzyme required for sulfatase activity
MRRAVSRAMVAAALVLLASGAEAQGAKPLVKCAADAVVAGTVCMDRYEASVWRIAGAMGANKGLVKKIIQGKATQVDLAKGGATQLGVAGDDYAPCADPGQNCANDIYAVSLAGATPSAHMTWFQAQAACENARKRLPSNAEWQAAVIGTPDPGPDDGSSDCRTTGLTAVPTGSRSRCVSARGVFDMVGNVGEWVSDWLPRSTNCAAWGEALVNDFQCILGAETSGAPGALIRGGDFYNGTTSGPLAVDASVSPFFVRENLGFRCAR